MQRVRLTWLVLTLGILLAGCGGDSSVEQLAEKEGLGSGAATVSRKVLLLSGGSDLASVLTYMSPLGFDLLDSENANVTTPTVTEMTGYDLVYYVSQYTPANPVGLGDNLADYMDAGGRVLIASYAHTASWGLQGRFVSGNYGAFTHGVGAYNTALTLGTVLQPAHPIMAGVSAVTSNFQDNPSVDPGSTVLAQWNTGVPLVAVAASGRAVGLTVFAVPSINPGNFVDLIGNAINFLLNN